MKLPVLILLIFLVLVVAAFVLALAFGGPGEPPPMPSISSPFKNADFSGLPPVSRFDARDGTKLAYRAYAPQGAAQGSVVLIHGSSAQSNTMHVMAKAFAAAGFAAYALDVRGHGDSGTKGQIAYIGQLDDDLEDFVRAVKPERSATLAGFSSGGGFALRIAGGARQKLFDNYLLLSPFINPDAPTQRRDSGGWVKVGIPRIVAIALLNSIGVRAFNGLPVVKFALAEEARKFLTPQYSFALLQNFGPERDYKANIRAMGQPVRLVAGQEDEVFYADRFAELFKSAGKEIPVTLVPGIGHIGLTLEPAGVQAAVAAVKSMDEARAGR